jgi:hypothetical protein
MGDLDDQIKFNVAALPDKFTNLPCSGASECRLAFANLAKEGLEEVAERLFAVANEDLAGFHPTPIVGVCCSHA